MLTRAISRSSYVCTVGTHSLTRCSASDWIRGRGRRVHADTLSAVARCSTVLCSTIPTTLNWNHRIGRRTDDGCGWRCAVFWYVCVCVGRASIYSSAHRRYTGTRCAVEARWQRLLRTHMRRCVLLLLWSVDGARVCGRTCLSADGRRQRAVQRI